MSRRRMTLMSLLREGGEIRGEGSGGREREMGD